MEELPVLCEGQVPDRYYKLISKLDDKKWLINIFVGQTPADIRTILTAIENGAEPTSPESAKLKAHFGPSYLTSLALDGPLVSHPVKYINDLIEVDDSVNIIKAKIAVYLKIPLDWQYLYAHIDAGANQSLDVCLGHTFVERPEDKNAEEEVIPFPLDPYEDINLVHPSMSYFIDPNTGFQARNYQKNDTNGSLINEYPIVNNEIYLVNICNFLQYFKSLKQDYTGTNLSKFKAGYLVKYWPVVTLESGFDKLYEACAVKSGGSALSDVFLDGKEYKEMSSRIERDRYMISLIKDPPAAIKEAPIEFDTCRILEIVLHINYNVDKGDFVDLIKVFNQYELNQRAPFVKYKGEKTKEPRHKLWKPIIEENSMETIQDWVSNIQKKKSEDSNEYRVTGKGLSFKRLLYQNETMVKVGNEEVKKVENKYATINFYKDGKIELKCFWEESRGAVLSDVKTALIDLVSLVNDINAIEYHLPGIDRRLRIAPPSLEFFGKENSNVQIAFINTVSRFDYGTLINFDQLNNFTACFNTFISIIPKNKVLEIDPKTGLNTYKTVLSTSLQLRYKRINNYLKMSEVEKFIHDIIKNTEGIDKLTVVKVLAERFNVVQDVADKIYLAYEASKKSGVDKKDQEKFGNLDFVLGKKVKKQPGIDIKIQGQESDKYKIFVLGAKNFFQLSMIHRFIKSLLRLYKKNDIISADPTFKTYTGKDMCQLSDNLIDEGIDESISAYQALEKNKPKQKLISKTAAEFGLGDLGDNDIDDIFALLTGEETEEGPAEADIDEELGIGEEPENVETVEEEPEEGEAKPAKLTVKPPTKFDYTKGVTALLRLKDADPKLFEGAKYAIRCQSNAHKQPMVIQDATYQTKKKEIDDKLKELKEKEAQLLKDKPNDYQTQLQQLLLERNRWNYRKESYGKGVSYRSHYYFCPRAYEYSTERILPDDEIITDSDGKMKDSITGNPIYYAKQKDNKKELAYAGFAKKDTHPDGELCPVCCYAKPNTGFGQCLIGQETAATSDKSNFKYILAAEKTGIPIGRFGMLPEVLHIIFNNKKKTENKIIVGFDAYLRKGVNPDPPHNVFLNAIGDAMKPPMDGNSVRKHLVSKLTLNNFLTLRSGLLKLIFDDPKKPNDETALANFSQFLLKDNFMNEDFLWDYLTTPGIIFPSGFNLFIFESQSIKGRISETINLKCPIGYDIQDLYNVGKPTLVLLKYSNRYEPIYRVVDDGTMMRTTELLPANHQIVKNLIPKMDQCNPETDINAYTNENNLLNKANKSSQYLAGSEAQNLKFEKQPFTAKKTQESLSKFINQAPADIDFKSYLIKAQIIDDYNKAVYFVLTNGFKLPIRPSSRIANLPIVTYASLSPLGFLESLKILTTLMTYTNLPTKPIVALTDGSAEKIVGILVINGFTIETLPLPIADYKSLTDTQFPDGKKLPTSEQYYESRNAVDNSIAGQLTSDQVDDRVHYVGLRQFEDETYQRLRYELSKELQKDKHAQLITDIREIVNNQALPVTQRRSQLFDLLEPLIKSMTVLKRSKDFNYDFYQVPNVRTACQGKPAGSCPHDPHCDVDATTQTCKLFIEPTNLIDPTKDNPNRYLSLVVEELLKNHLRRNELLTDQVDNTVDEEVFEYRPEEYIFRENTYKDNKRKLENLYKKGIDYHERLSRLYDIANPSSNSGYDQVQNLSLSKITESSCNKAFLPLTIYWIQNIGEAYRRLSNDKSTNCIYYALTLALNQRGQKKDSGKTDHTISNIRETIAQNISQLKDEVDPVTGDVVRKGWRMLLDHYRYKYKDKFMDIFTESELKKLMSSDVHQLSLIDLIMISQVYNVKFIIMSNKGGVVEVKERIICMGTTSSLNDDYILLYKVGQDDFEIIGNTAFSPAKYIFTKEELPTKLYQLWVQVCSLTDMKPKIDDKFPLLFNAPLYKTFNIAPTNDLIPGVEIKATSAKTYFVDPKTDMVLAQQSTKKKIPMKPKIAIDAVKADPEEDKFKAKLVDLIKTQKIPMKFKNSTLAPATAPVIAEPVPITVTKQTLKKKEELPAKTPLKKKDIEVPIAPKTPLKKKEESEKAHTIDDVHLQGLTQPVVDQLIQMNIACKDKKPGGPNYIQNPKSKVCVKISGPTGKKLVASLLQPEQQ
jgi:hypothetical protein